MSNIGTLIQAYQDKHGVSDRALARRIDVSATLIGRWKRGVFSELPMRDRIEALSNQIAVDYSVLLEAFLLDVGYLGEAGEGHVDGSPSMTDEDQLSARRGKVANSDLADLPSVAKKRKPRTGE